MILTREVMLKRLVAGEDAMDLAILKWELLSEATDTELKMVRGLGLHSGLTCALCHIHVNLKRSPCEGCPVSLAGFDSCVGTPYYLFTTCLKFDDFDGARKEAMEFVRLLKNIKRRL